MEPTAAALTSRPWLSPASSPSSALPSGVLSSGAAPVGLLVGLLALGAGIVVAVPMHEETFWLAALWVAWGASVVSILASRRPSLAFAGLCLWMLLDVVGPATFAVTEGITQVGGFRFDTGTVGALRLATATQVALLVGVVVARAVEPVVRARTCRIRVPAVRLDRWAVALLLAGVGSMVALTVAGGGGLRSLNVLTGGLRYGELARTNDADLAQLFKMLAGVAGAGMLVATVRLTSARPRSRWVPLGILVASALFLVARGGRAALVIPAVACALVWWKTTSNPWARRPRRLLLAATLVLFVGVAIVGGLRGQEDTKSVDLVAFAEAELRTGVFATSAGLVETVPAEVDHLYGRSLTEAVYLPVPRAWWDEKPTSSLDDLQARFIRRPIGASFGFSGEMYANFGLMGAFVVCALFAGALEAIWLRLAATTSVRRLIVTSALVPLLLHLFTRSHVGSQLLGQLGFLAGAAIAASLVARVARPDESTQHESTPNGPSARRDLASTT